MDRRTFERLVAAAIDALPPDFLQKLDNVEVVIEDWPDRQTMHRAGVRHQTQLLGFYHGVPQTRRTRSYTLVLPDKISIYRYPIEMRCRTPAEVQATIEHVLRHEIAHHFGIDDDRLRELGAY
ncbi:MAG: metallopeptidase family protein [Anaerolineae bacterium]